MSQAIDSVKRERDSSPKAPGPAMAAAAGSTGNYTGTMEIGLGYEQFGRLKQPERGFDPESSSKKISPQFLQVPPYALEQGPSRGTFGSLATQDFLQPLERGANGNVAAKVVPPVANGAIPLQLSSRNDRSEPVVLDPSAKESCSSRMQLQMQYGYMDHQHSLFPKNGMEVNQPAGVNASRHWQQGHVNNANKRPRSAQSDGDDNDSEERRKIHSRSGDAMSKEVSSRSIDAKSNASRSKHSATEQRRRSKINDRFQMLRDLLPHGDQKRDKASFLLEVIEYVQALQERVKKFETLEKGRYQDRFKPVPWDVKTNTDLKEIPEDKCALLDDGKSRTLMGTAVAGRQIGQAPARSTISPLLSCSPAVEDVDAAAATNEKSSEPENKQQQTNDIARSTSSQPVPREGQQQQLESSDDRGGLEHNQLPIKKGLISLSSAYSQGLLEALTRALQSSGLDLSTANISVQIELGKPQGNKG